MRRTPSFSLFGATLLATLGLGPFTACGGSTTGGGASGGADAGGSGGAAGWLACRNPSPLLGPDGKPTGFTQCEGGGLHRPEAVDCRSALPRADFLCPFGGAPDSGFTGGCTTDADCTERPNGYCAGWAPEPSCGCNYGCTADADCGAGQICLCGDPVGQCVSAECGRDGDCGEGALCLRYSPNPGCPGTAFACQTRSDTCVGDDDCTEVSGQCTLVEGAHVCQPVSCVVGRPFLVGGEARLPPQIARRDWTRDLCPVVLGLTAAERASIGQRWAEIGQMEHASIAAFARFSLDLLALGAPPELLLATQRAMADETAHARDAFALASAYLGRPTGPGPLDVRQALTGREPLDIFRTTVLEGCVGETIAAVEATEALALAVDPAVREALARVTVEETQHAELAFRFVKWVLAAGPADLRAAARRELVAIVEAELGAAELARVRPFALPPRGVAHGVVPEAVRAELRRRALAEVVLPCVRALVQSTEATTGLTAAA